MEPSAVNERKQGQAHEHLPSRENSKDRLEVASDALLQPAICNSELLVHIEDIAERPDSVPKDHAVSQGRLWKAILDDELRFSRTDVSNFSRIQAASIKAVAKDQHHKCDGAPVQIRPPGSGCNVVEGVVTNPCSAANLKHTTRESE